MAIILNGKSVSEKLTEAQKRDIISLKGGRVPRLCVIRIGENKSDIAYENSIKKHAQKIGADVSCINLSASVNKSEILSVIDEANNNGDIHGILLFRPLSDRETEDEACGLISPTKDIDCANPLSLLPLLEGLDKGFVPCTALAAIQILDFYGYDLKGANVAVLGRSMVIGKPLSLMLLSRDATVIMCHSGTKNLRDICKRSDIIVSAIGKAGFVDDTYIGKNQVIIDVGINVTEDGRVCGDVAFNEVESKVSAITPVPQGVGSVTVSVLFKQLLDAYRRNYEEK